ncbi:MAG: LUD domain-containing protein [Flavobacteriales bacterium AspAUS03]
MNEGKFSTFWCVDTQLQSYLKQLGLNFRNIPDTTAVNLMRCEYLIAKDGSIMLSSDQTDGRHLLEFSNTFIIVAISPQIVSDIDEALQKIKASKGYRIPRNITTIKGYDPAYFQSPSQIKDIYLLLSDYDEN